MPQKPLKPSGGKVSKPGKKQQQAGNRHGKAPQMKKGRVAITPRDPKLLAAYKDARELTKAINSKNEQQAAAKATAGGGRLAVLKKAAPPVLDSKDRRQKAKAAAAAAASGAGAKGRGGGHSDDDEDMEGGSD